MKDYGSKSPATARRTAIASSDGGGRFQCPPFDDAAARSFGRVSAALRRAGRKVKARTFDAMIAATALANDLPLHTCNPDDFSSIDGLEVVAVPVPHGEEG